MKIKSTGIHEYTAPQSKCHDTYTSMITCCNSTWDAILYGYFVGHVHLLGIVDTAILKLNSFPSSYERE
jgi:hypothetical protein